MDRQCGFSGRKCEFDDSVSLPRIEDLCPTVDDMVENGGILRDSDFIKVITAASALLTLLFTVALIFWADNVTSQQWRYLFTIPGGQYTWAALFGTAAVGMLVGLWRSWYRMTAAGHALLGVSSALVALFYAIAPIIDDSMVTFGWYPWLVTLVPTTVGAAIFWRPISWF